MSEMLTITTPDGSFSAYVARPATLPAPVVVVLQEVFGINADMRKSSDELAEAGFIAICPDLFWRQAPNIELSDKTDWDRAFALYQAYDIDKGVKDIEATLEFGRTLSGSTGKVGLTGFCLGGLMTCLTTARSHVDASVSYYGGRTEEFLAEAPGIKTPWIMHVGDEDEYISKPAQAAIKAALAGKPGVEIYTYAGCAHAFTRHDGTRYDAAAAAMANKRTVDFFHTQLAA